MSPFGFMLFGTLCTSQVCVSISFARLGKLSVIITSNRFLISCSLSSLFGAKVVYSMLFQRPLKLSLIFFFFFAVLIGCFLLPYIQNNWFSPLLHLFYCSFPLVHSSFLTGSFFMVSMFIFHAVKVLSNCLENSYNHCFELCIGVDCLPLFHLVLFLKNPTILSFGAFFFVSLFLATSLFCFYVLGRVAIYSRCPVGPSGTVSLLTGAGCSTCVLYVSCMWPPAVVEAQLLFVGIDPQVDGL